jgi:Na+-transporting methylmalonyl-CoA/oxaloacetate decarboxylase gamma subunit
LYEEKGEKDMGVNVGDLLFQLVSFLILVALISGLGMIIKRFVRGSRQLDRIEEKVDQLKEEKRRERP